MRTGNYMAAAAATMLFFGAGRDGPDSRLDIRPGGRQSGGAEHGRPEGEPGQSCERRTGQGRRVPWRSRERWVARCDR